jgi:nitric oxide reductase NorD protein
VNRARAAARRVVLKGRFTLRSARDAAVTFVRKQRPVVELEQVQRRLELLLAAMYGKPIPISSAKQRKRRWYDEVSLLLNRDPRSRETTSSTDGSSIELPASLTARDGEENAIARYRLLAIQQAERIERGTALYAPMKDMIAGDLYMVREGAIIDAAIARAHPGLASTLEKERREALERRPSLERLSRPEREVEVLLRDALTRGEHTLPASATEPADTLAWAREMATKIRGDRGLYRGLPFASVWGALRPSPGNLAEMNSTAPKESRPPKTGATQKLAPKGWHKANSHDAQEGIAHNQDAPSSGAMLSADAPPTGAEDDRRGKETEELSDHSDADGPKGFAGNTGTSAQISEPIDDDAFEGLPPATLYDEWDAAAGRYVARSISVRVFEPKEGDERWSLDVLQRHPALVRQVRHQFERLRARRMVLNRQRAGDDLDVAACVTAIVDRRIGHTPDDRLYLDARPARRGTAISLLVDTSGSTEQRVTAEWRIIDLERIALLLAGEALDALGEQYAIHAFSGKSSRNVALTTVKDFNERSGPTMRKRIAGLEPGGFTRLGAAVRFATRGLAHQSAGHRLLLILSDGRPNDVDAYQSEYGVEDARQAIMEARASGVYPFCITVDRDASEYLPRIFGRTGHTILQRPEQLPRSLLGAVRALIGQR